MRIENTICGKCGTPIPAQTESCPQCFPRPSKTEAIPLFLIVVLLCSSFLMVGSSYVNVATGPSITVPKQKPPADLSLAAYEAAKEFIVQRSPGAKTFSEFNQSPVEKKGNSFNVVISVDEFTPQNIPVRNFYTVEVEFSDGAWKLKQIKQ